MSISDLSICLFFAYAVMACFQPAQAADFKPTDAKTDVELETTKTGTLSEKPADAKAGVIAVLHVDNEGRKGKKNKKNANNSNNKKGVAPGPEETFFLTAKGDLAARITDFLKRSATCQITGVLTPDGLGMNVTDAVESAPVKEKKAKASN